MKVICALLTWSFGGLAMAGMSESLRDEWIGKLASESFSERVEATEALWAEGEKVEDALRQAARSSEPEMALRARDLLRKIDMGITPETSSRVVRLVEEYAGANQSRKTTIMHELRRQRAWRQILRLYAGETDASTREQLGRMMDGIALLAARERLANGAHDAAREYLEMVRDTSGGMLALAAFHRAMGTLDAEIELLGEPVEREDLMWLNAMQRVSGDTRGAADSAWVLGETRLAAAMEMMMGDPLPWLEQVADEESDATRYGRAAAMRWRGERASPELDRIRRNLRSPDEPTRLRAMGHLFLLGEVDLAWDAYEREYAQDAFLHYDLLEQLDDALRMLGLDPAEPDFAGFLEPMLRIVCQAPGADADDGDGDEEMSRDDELDRFVGFCNFLERRGVCGVLDAVVMPALLEFGRVHQRRFTDLMSDLFGTPSLRSGAPEFAMRVAAEWAGDDEARWDEMLIAAFGEDRGYERWRELLRTVDPDAGMDGHLRAMLAVFGYTRDGERLYEQTLEKVWAHFEAGEDKAVVLEAIDFMVGNMTDIEQIGRLRELQVDDEGDPDLTYRNLFVDTAAGRWGELARVFQSQIAAQVERGDARAELYAYAAVCLRNAGMEDEARDHEKWVDLLALGETRVNLAVAQAYSFGRDYARAMEWYRRAILEGEPSGSRFAQALLGYITELLEVQEHALVAACTEVLAYLEVAETGLAILPFNLTRRRQQADFARAMAMPRDQAEQARALLREAHAIMPTDGALADHFFPALFESEFTDLHDELFEVSWKRLMDTLELFPDSDNTMNTAGWFASRSVRRLDEAMPLQQRALGIYPRSAAYLDTLGEIYFAMGNRERAVHFGAEALRFMPHETMIIRQYERFVHGDMPVRR